MRSSTYEPDPVRRWSSSSLWRRLKPPPRNKAPLLLWLLALVLTGWSCNLVWYNHDKIVHHYSHNQHFSTATLDYGVASHTNHDLASQYYAHVVQWKIGELKHFFSKFFEGKNLVCDVANKARLNNGGHHAKTLLNVTVYCDYLLRQSDLGSGNWLMGLYGMRLAAKLSGNVDILLHCIDAETAQTNLILPWAMGFFATSTADSKRLRSVLTFKERQQACGAFWLAPVGYLYQEFEYELRRMALALVGVPPSDSPIYNAVTTWIQDNHHWDASHLQLGTRGWLPLLYEEDDDEEGKNVDEEEEDSNSSHGVPLYPNIQLDDTVIHFRCGDLMNSTHPHYGFMQYRAFVDRIHSPTRSIGIVTQPFDDTYTTTRHKDLGTGERCRVVLMDFVSYVHERLPQARVTIHNGRNESLAVTFARMILAHQTITGVGTFGIFPAMVSFGMGYARKPDRTFLDTLWLLDTPLEGLGINLVLMEEPNMLMVKDISDLWMESDGEAKILSWFRNGSLPPP